MYLSVNEMLRYTDEERQRWEQWFLANGDELLAMPILGERESTIGRLIMHIFGPELRYVERLRNEAPTDYRGLPASSIETVFGFGLKTRQKMRDYIASLAAGDWETIVDLELPGGPTSASVRKIVLHTLIHEVRHWAQIARLLRERGLVPPGQHDLLNSQALK
jgi:uncharacterized damage-inducible protein DinB